MTVEATSPTRMLVLSDLHAFVGDDGDRAPSKLNFFDERAAESLFERCLAAVQKAYSTIDLVLVAGDITNHAQPKALERAWLSINELASALGASVVATSGNHDYDSRGIGGPNLPHQGLLDLDPPFPTGDSGGTMHYFTYGFAIVVTNEFVVVTLNSAATHGLAFDGRDEYRHGRVTPSTLKKLADKLSSLGELPTVRVLLTHHHLFQLPDIDTSETSQMVGAEGIVRVLQPFGDWMVVHGHKHRAWLQYGAGGGDAPTILSAASFAANFEGTDFEGAVLNQFHVVEFAPLEITPMQIGSRSPMKGAVHSWNFNGIDWLTAGRADDLSGQSGFGWRPSLASLAADIRKIVTDRSLLDSGDIEKEIPMLKFLTQEDMRQLVSHLESGTPAVGVFVSAHGTIDQFYSRLDRQVN